MYCKNYNLQGHKESECFILHPELRMEEEKVDVSEEPRGKTRTITSGSKVIGPPKQL